MRVNLLLAPVLVTLLCLVACDGGSGSNNNTNVSVPPVEPPIEPPIEPPFVSPADNAVIVDGNVWLQPADFTGYRYDQVNAVCHGPDGVCLGSLQGSTFDLTGYKWASIMDVSSLFNAYGVNPPFTEPFQYREDDDASLAMSQDFTVSGEWCFGDCPFGFDLVIGMVRDEAPTGMPPYLPHFDTGDCIEWPVDCGFSNTTGFESDEIQTPDDGIGIWFWKPSQKIILGDKEWLQPADFIGYTYDEVSVVCPVGACSGTLPRSSFDLTGYTWASLEEVSALFNSYGLNPPFTGPNQRREDDPNVDASIAQDFTITTLTCGGDCPVDFYFVAGTVRDPAPVGALRYTPYFLYTDDNPLPPRPQDLVFDNTDFSYFGAELALEQVGVWLWKPAIPDIIEVDGKEWLQPDLFTNLSWNDITAVCPEGACAGTLNGYDMTGWTWASVDDINALFNYYIGADVLGPGPSLYYDDFTSAWATTFYEDGWRSTRYSSALQEYETEGYTRSKSEQEEAYMGSLVDLLEYGFAPIDLASTNMLISNLNESGNFGGWFYRAP